MLDKLSNSEMLGELISFLQDDEYKLIEHSSEVVKIAMEFGKYLELDNEDMISLQTGAYLHDLGKIKVDPAILNKPGKLTDEEFETVKKHSLEGFFLLRKNHFVGEDVLDIALQHHERPDGKGYPFGLKDRAINPLAKIVSLCDVYEALTAERCYKKSMPKESALDIIYDNLGSQFDEDLGVQFLAFMGYEEKQEAM